MRIRGTNIKDKSQFLLLLVDALKFLSYTRARANLKLVSIKYSILYLAVTATIDPRKNILQ